MMKYERLNQNISILNMHNHSFRSVKQLTDGKKTENQVIDEIVHDIAEILDKIENGTLIELPCKVGDTAYCCNYGDKGWRILKGYVNEINIDVNGIYVKCDYEYSLSFWHKITNYDVFFNIEEVENKLKELQNG